jgi:hypothetical protein
MPAQTTQYASRDTEEAHTNGVADDVARERLEAANDLADMKVLHGIQKAELAQLRWERRRGQLTTTSFLSDITS